MLLVYTLHIWVLPLLVVITCMALALRRTRWSHAASRVSLWTFWVLLPLSLLYFPLKAGGVRPIECEWTFSLSLAVQSLGNYPHMIMMAIFVMLAVANLPNVKHPIAWSLAAAFALGFLVEIAEGATGVHHCRMRDLIPDMTGACIGALAVLIVRRLVASRTPAANAA